MFSKILVANRGEIAVRIIRSCKEMGISTVAVFSEADREALHVNLADESICIGSSTAAGSYLNMSSILSAAIVTNAQAIHPGYGFLAENAKFAKLCQKCNIVFIGPPSDIISKMGDKNIARKTMKAANVPVISGSDIIKDLKHAQTEAQKIGYPVMIKACSGGGGRGIRLVNNQDELKSAYFSAAAEAQSAFGDGSLYIEKYLSPVKHIEMQILCDNFGNVVCLGERDCSIQRKNQKLLEESPAFTIDEKTREEMIQCSIRGAKAVGYKNIGTIEFLFDKDNNFYFMEMNTRLQVEHPVTEMVTGIDLVKWQIRVAANLPLTFTQKDIQLSGHAIECRINAENAKNYCPNSGQITLLHIPGGPWVRFDSALYQNYVVPPFYDSMIAKLIVHAKTREEAIRKMQAALCELVIEGIGHNTEIHLNILSDDRFKKGTYYTDFLK